MEIYTTSKARQNLFSIVENVAKSHEPVYIAGKNNNAVIISQEDYESLLETLYICSVPGLKDEIIKQGKLPLSDYSTEVDWGE